MMIKSQAVRNRMVIMLHDIGTVTVLVMLTIRNSVWREAPLTTNTKPTRKICFVH